MSKSRPSGAARHQASATGARPAGPPGACPGYPRPGRGYDRGQILEAANDLCCAHDRYAARGAIARPAPGRAAEACIHDCAPLDEFTVATSWPGRPVETLQARIRLPTEAKLPAEHRDQIVAEATVAIDRIAGS